MSYPISNFVQVIVAENVKVATESKHRKFGALVNYSANAPAGGFEDITSGDWETKKLDIVETGVVDNYFVNGTAIRLFDIAQLGTLPESEWGGRQIFTRNLGDLTTQKSFWDGLSSVAKENIFLVWYDTDVLTDYDTVFGVNPRVSKECGWWDTKESYSLYQYLGNYEGVLFYPKNNFVPSDLSAETGSNVRVDLIDRNVGALIASEGGAVFYYNVVDGTGRNLNAVIVQEDITLSIQETVLSRLLSASDISYTNPNIQGIATVIDGVIGGFVNLGPVNVAEFSTQNPTTTWVPREQQVPSDVASGIVRGYQAYYVYPGEIKQTVITLNEVII